MFGGVLLTLGSTCTLLCKIPLTPISVELLLKIAPSQFVASHTTKVSTLLAATITTRSPFRTLLACTKIPSMSASIPTQPERGETTMPPAKTH